MTFDEKKRGTIEKEKREGGRVGRLGRIGEKNEWKSEFAAFSPKTECESMKITLWKMFFPFIND